MKHQPVCYPCGAPIVSTDKKCAYCQTEYSVEHINVRSEYTLACMNAQSPMLAQSLAQQQQAASFQYGIQNALGINVGFLGRIF